ncbi:MAG: hypothetical protein M3R04_08395 [bacterium]|nr:hypothetical protein [bacterium]
MNWEAGSIQLKYKNTEPKVAKINSSWFCDDDYLLAVMVNDSTLRVLAVLGYGVDPVELSFEGVQSWNAAPNLRAESPIEISDGRVKLVKLGSNLQHIEITGNGETVNVAGRMVWMRRLLLSVSYERVLVRDCEYIRVGEEQFTAPRPATIGSKLLALAIGIAIVALIAFFALARK